MKYRLMILAALLLIGMGARTLEVDSQLRGVVFADKETRMRLEEYRITDPGEERWRWYLDNQVIGSGPQLTLARPGNGVLPGVVDAADGNTGGILLSPPANDVGRPVPCQVRLNLFVPEVIYDDEERELHWELVSRLPATLNFTVRCVSRGGDAWQLEKQVELPGTPIADRFSAGAYHKETRSIHGGDIVGTTDLHWEVGVPNWQILSRDLILSPIAEVPELVAGPGGKWCNRQGEEVIVVLHRKSLEEQRKFEFLRRALNVVRPDKRVFVVGEEFLGRDGGRFSEALRTELAARGYELVWHPWFEAGVPERSWHDAIPEALNALRASDAQRVLIVPPVAPNRDGDRTQEELLRMLDVVIQSAWLQPETRRLGVGIPWSRTDAPDPFESGTRALLRDSGATVVELRQALLEFDGEARESVTEGSSLPAEQLEACAAIVADGIAGL